MFRRFLICLAALFVAPKLALGADYTLITLLHTNDMHGSVLSPSPGQGGGLAKIATVVRHIRSEMPNVLLIDAGDIIHGSYEDYLSSGAATISAMNAAGYNLGEVGNHEFDFGLEVTEKAVKTAAFPMLAANVREKASGGSWSTLQPYVILPIGGVNVGVIGLATPESVSLQWPPSVATIAVDDPFKVAKRLVPELRKKADVVVVLSHLGYGVDLELAKKVAGIDFIVGGHTHSVVDKWQFVGDTLVTQAGAYGEYLGRIDFIVGSNGGGKKMLSVNGKGGRLWNDLRVRPLDKTYPTSPLIGIPASTLDDEAVVAAYRPFRDKANEMLDSVIGESSADVPVAASPTVESPAANLAADAIRSVSGADVAVVEASSVAAGLKAGPVTNRDAFNMIAGFTRQRIVVIRLKGSDLLKALSSNLLRGSSDLRLQLSGMTLGFRAGTKGVALSRVTVGGSAIDPNREYTLAGQAYIVQGFLSAVPASVVVSDSLGTTREAIAAYVKSVGRVLPPILGRVVRG